MGATYVEEKDGKKWNKLIERPKKERWNQTKTKDVLKRVKKRRKEKEGKKQGEKVREVLSVG